MKYIEFAYDSPVNDTFGCLGGVGLFLTSDVNTDLRVSRLRVTGAEIFRSGIAERPNRSSAGVPPHMIVQLRLDGLNFDLR